MLLFVCELRVDVRDEYGSGVLEEMLGWAGKI